MGKWGWFGGNSGAIFACALSFASPPCEVESDQEELFLPPPQTVPLRVRAFENDGLPKKLSRDALDSAISTWNRYTRTAFGSDLVLFSEGFGSGRFEIPRAWNAFANPPPQEVEVHFASDLIPARSSTLAYTQRIYARGVSLFQTIEVGTRVPREQLVSVLVHELGHVLGLDHSCLGSKEDGHGARCEDFRATHPYRVAVMSPSLVGREKKETLRDNDRSRLVCSLRGSRFSTSRGP